MVGFLIGLCAAGVAGGLWVAYMGLRGRRLLPGSSRSWPQVDRWQVAAGAGGLLAGVVVWAVSGWPAAGLLAGGAVAAAPWLLAGSRDREEQAATGEAIATWTEMIRDAHVGGAQIGAAIHSTAEVAPDAIAEQVRAAVGRSDTDLADALVQLGDDLDHPAADQLVVILARAAAGKQASGLGAALSRLAQVMRERAQLRRRVESSRSKVRTAVRSVLGAAVLLLLLLAGMSRDLLAAYSTTTGQVVLLAVGAIFAVAGLWLRQLMHIETPGRFRARGRSSRP